MWRCKYSSIEEIDKINDSELLKIYISLNVRENKHMELEQCLEHMNSKSGLTVESKFEYMKKKKKKDF